MSEFENKNNSENEEIIKSDKAAFEEEREETVQEAEIAEPAETFEDEEYIPFSKRILKEIISWILCIAIAFCAAMVIRTWVFTVVRVDGPSMRKNATEGDRIWIDEQSGAVHLKKKESNSWEILDEDYILETSYFAGIAQKFADDSGEGLLIEKDHVFVMGDNRNNSTDSRIDYGDRAVGQVHVDSIIGKAFFRWWPLNDVGIIK